MPSWPTGYRLGSLFSLPPSPFYFPFLLFQFHVHGHNRQDAALADHMSTVSPMYMVAEKRMVLAAARPRDDDDDDGSSNI